MTQKSQHVSLLVPFTAIVVLAGCIAANTNIWWGLLTGVIGAVGIGLVERHGNNA